jgi:hypothetical protein
MNEEQQTQFDNLITMVQSLFATRNVPSEDQIRAYIEALRPMSPALTNELFEEAFQVISSRRSVRMDLGVLLEAEGHRPWLQDREIEWGLWQAYKQMLANEGRSSGVLETLDLTLDRILDHMGDPTVENAWARRGLVIGDVQSGKTGTYIGLIDKAIDVGYKVIILLTGNTEPLRRQTQKRVDEGVTGRDSSRSKTETEGSNVVGVGNYPELFDTKIIDSMTSLKSDFTRQSLYNFATVPSSNKVVIFVTKKNKLILESIHTWFKSAVQGDAKIHLPLLLIDDEADYASVNTNKPEDDPTAINRAIKNLLERFSRNCYVGFTATPFANVFIDDDDEIDLFPRDFIYGLKAPTSYIGPRELFGDGDETALVREIDDAQPYFPIGHDKTLSIEGIPDSLYEAIRTYFITNAIRDLRGQVGRPTTMLINVSRLNAIQTVVAELVQGVVSEYKNALDLHSAAFAKGVPHPSLEELKLTFQEEFSDSEFEWADVLSALPQANAIVAALVENSKIDKKRERPDRYIAIGGDLLSRGLTLDGLSTSYFYRVTGAADTLMQMGRWFGYREGYADICRVWITPDMVGAYSRYADSLEGLRTELEEMHDQGLTPRHYGISVQLHPDALLITAKNKMRHVKIGPKFISPRGTEQETPTLPNSDNRLKANVAAVRGLLSDLTEKYGPASSSRQGRPLWSEVDKDYVASFLSEFDGNAGGSLDVFYNNGIVDFVKHAEAADLQTWDVALVGGKGSKKFDLPGVPESFCPPTRAFGGGHSGLPWKVSGNKMRVAGTGDVGTPLDQATYDHVRATYRERIQRENLGINSKDKPLPKTINVPDGEYTRVLKRPLLLIYPLVSPDVGKSFPMCAIAIAIPGRRTKDERNIRYLLNKPAQKSFVAELQEATSEDDDDYS